jgi:hypothetical protein
VRLFVIAVLWGALFSGGTICAPGKKCEVNLRLKVPDAVSHQVARRVAGEAPVPPPILMLQGLEFGANGFDIEVRAQPDPGSSETGVVVGTGGIVGSTQPTAPAARIKINLPVPLNDRARALLANRSEINLTLKIVPIGDLSEPITLETVFFQVPKAP